MPKLTLLLGRRAVRVYDLAQVAIVVGRDTEADIVIDNPSVSRRHAEIRQEGGGWVVEDLGSSNGTFLRGQRLEGTQAIAVGDEIGFGKFSIVFDKVVGDDVASAGGPSVQTTSLTGVEGTMHIRASEVRELLKDSERKKRAHVDWQSGGQRGSHYPSEASAALFGTDELCDVRVPKGPKHHVLVVHREGGCEVRNLTAWSRMKFRGGATKRAVLKDGDVVEIGGLKLTYIADIA